jgi:G:T/U-mismatch repair DNA glycosylase
MPKQPLLPDHLRPELNIVFVGINPGRRSAELGHHYAGHSNRFWKLIYDANLVPEPLSYRDDGRLPEWGLGLTNLVSRSTASMASLTLQDYAAGRLVLMRENSPISAACRRPAGHDALPHPLSTRTKTDRTKTRSATSDTIRLQYRVTPQPEWAKRILSLPFHAGGFSYADTVGQERPQESSLTYPIHAVRSAGIPSGTCCKICG